MDAEGTAIEVAAAEAGVRAQLGSAPPSAGAPSNPPDVPEEPLDFLSGAQMGQAGLRQAE